MTQTQKETESHHFTLLLYFRKELKDPDQLYSTLKTILQHVKVRDTNTHAEHL